MFRTTIPASGEINFARESEDTQKVGSIRSFVIETNYNLLSQKLQEGETL